MADLLVGQRPSSSLLDGLSSHFGPPWRGRRSRRYVPRRRDMDLNSSGEVRSETSAGVHETCHTLRGEIILTDILQVSSLFDQDELRHTPVHEGADTSHTRWAETGGVARASSAKNVSAAQQVRLLVTV